MVPRFSLLSRLIAVSVTALFITACGGDDTETRTVTETVTEYGTNNVPVIAVDGIGRAMMTSQFTLDGSASYDTDGTIASWSWTQVDNGAPVANLSGANGSIVTVTAPVVSTPEDLTFRLTIADDKGTTATTTHTVTIEPIFAYSPCQTDDISAFPASGTYSTGRVADVIGFCDGEILIGNATSNLLEFVDLASGTVTASYALSAAPLDLSYDPVRGLVYAAMKGASSVARLDLIRDELDYIPVQGMPSAIAARHANGVYTVSSSGLYWYDANDQEHGPFTITGDMIQFNQESREILSAERGVSPSVLYLYEFDGNGDIVALENTGSAGGNAQTLKISPDNDHVVMVSGGGNGNGYAITDFYSQDLSVSYGEFFTGAYPTGGDFSADSLYFATANHDEFLVYRVDTHAETFRVTPPSSGCSYNDLDGAYISRGGKIGLVRQRCGFNDETTNLHFYKLP